MQRNALNDSTTYTSNSPSRKTYANIHKYKAFMNIFNFISVKSDFMCSSDETEPLPLYPYASIEEFYEIY